MAGETVESLQEKCRTLEAECHSLLQRSIQSEQKHSDAAAERDRLKSSAGDMRQENEQLEKRVRALKAENDELNSQLAAQVEAAGGDLDIMATLEKEKSNARRANELRMELEGNFAELSVQFETLQENHVALTIDNKQKTKDLEATMTHVENLEKNVSELETAAAQAVEEKDSIAAVLNGVNKEFAKEKKAHEKCREDLRRVQNSLQESQQELEAQQVASDKVRRDYDALKKKSVVWKKQAEHARDLEIRNEQLAAQFAFSQKELADARKEIGRLQAQLLAVEEAEKSRLASSISPKTLQFLRDQLAEANEKLKALRGKERTWLEQRSALEAQVKRLRFELQRKNPSQLRLMEMEVQNELLLNMLQTSNSPARAAKPSSIPKAAPRQPPRKLPPISDEAGGSPTPSKATSGSGATAARNARLNAQTPPPSSSASEAGGDRTPLRSSSAAEMRGRHAAASPPPVAAEPADDDDDATPPSSSSASPPKKQAPSGDASAVDAGTPTDAASSAAPAAAASPSDEKPAPAEATTDKDAAKPAPAAKPSEKDDGSDAEEKDDDDAEDEEDAAEEEEAEEAAEEEYSDDAEGDEGAKDE